LVGLPVHIGSVSPSAARIAKAVELPLQPDMEGSHVGQTKTRRTFMSPGEVATTHCSSLLECNEDLIAAADAGLLKFGLLLELRSRNL
jgi:hypothetical protein